MFRLKVTAERRGSKLVVANREIIGEIEDDPHYWDAICNLLLSRMEHDGLIVLRKKEGDIATTA